MIKINNVVLWRKLRGLLQLEEKDPALPALLARGIGANEVPDVTASPMLSEVVIPVISADALLTRLRVDVSSGDSAIAWVTISTVESGTEAMLLGLHCHRSAGDRNLQSVAVRPAGVGERYYICYSGTVTQYDMPAGALPVRLPAGTTLELFHSGGSADGTWVRNVLWAIYDV